MSYQVQCYELAPRKEISPHKGISGVCISAQVNVRTHTCTRTHAHIHTDPRVGIRTHCSLYTSLNLLTSLITDYSDGATTAATGDECLRVLLTDVVRLYGPLKSAARPRVQQ